MTDTGILPKDQGGATDADILTPNLVSTVVDALETGDEDRIRLLVANLHAADLADLISLIRPDDRRSLVQSLGPDIDPEMLSELDEGVRDEVLPLLNPESIARAVEALESDDAIYLIEDLEEDRQREILNQIEETSREVLEKSLQYPDESAGRLMQREVITVPPFWTVGQVIDYMRDTDDLPNQFFEIFVVDPTHHPLGIVPSSRILRTKRPVKIADIMDRDPIVIPAVMDQEEVAYRFEQYHLVSAPVVDEDSRLCGMITVDDVVGVIQEENQEDILALGGVTDEAEMTDAVLKTTGRRFTWLLANLGTAILASVVIALFDATIEQFVALAILMPIIASMGGNAGTQTLTVAVRAIATKELTGANAFRIVTREALVGAANGFIFAIILGAAGGLWFQSVGLGLVLAAAMIVNLLCAGLSGILIPLGLQRAGVDPAVGSTVLVTTVTDVVGFFVFLGLAAWYLL